MNKSQNAFPAINAAHVGVIHQTLATGAPIVQGEPLKPVVTQCRPPSKIGCVFNAPTKPVVPGEPVKLIVTQPAASLPACGEIYYSETASPDIGLIFTMIVAGILGNCR